MAVCGPRARPALIGLFSAWVLLLLLLPALLGENGRPLGAEVEQRQGRWLVIAVDDGGAAARAGLRVGDVIVAVAGAAPRSRDRTDPGLHLDTTGAWTVARRGALLTLRPAPSGDYSTPLVLLAIALAGWCTAAGVRLLQPRDGLAARLYRLSLCIALVLALTTAADDDVLWAKGIEVAAFALLPAQLVRFCLQLAQGDRAAGRPALAVRGLALTGGAIGCAYLLSGVFGLPSYDPLRQALLGLLALAFLAGLGILAHAVARPRSPLAQRQVTAVLLGTAASALPLTILCLAPLAAGRPALARPQLVALSAVCFPLSVQYAILRHRLLDLRPAIRRTLIYAAMTVLLAGCYALFLYLLAAARLGPHGDRLAPLSLAFFALVSMTFMPLRTRVVRLVDRLVFHDRYDYARTLQRLGADLASVRPLDEALAGVVDTLASAMNLRGAAVLLRRAGGDLALRAASGDCRRPAWEREIVLPGHASCDPAAGRDDGRWLPLTSHGVEQGLLYLAAKRSGAEFRAGDLRLVETLAHQAGAAIANGLLVEQLQARVAELAQLRDRLLRVQEEEHRSVARDLHDGPLQTVLALLRQLDATLASLPALCRDAPMLDARLREMIERGQDAADELRMLCAGLYPPELRHLGLPAALAQLARDTSRDEPLIVRFAVQGLAEGTRLPAEVEEALYRIAREALRNVLRHAAARHAEIRLALVGEGVTLTVRDDGRGFSVPTSPAALLHAGHLGLAGMRARSERLGGDWQVRAAPGAGTTVEASLPVPPPRAPAPPSKRQGGADA